MEDISVLEEQVMVEVQNLGTDRHELVVVLISEGIQHSWMVWRIWSCTFVDEFALAALDIQNYNVGSKYLFHEFGSG